MSKLPGIYEIFNHEFARYQSIYIISDTHFGDAELRESFSERPTDEELVKRINSTCGKTSLIIHLGDVGDISFISKLRGDKWLIKGNHDQGSSKYERQCLKITYNAEEYSLEAVKKDLVQRYPGWKISYISESYGFKSPFQRWEAHIDNCLFDKIFEGPVLLSEKLILSHEPIELSWAHNIHGHCHIPLKDESGTNVCLDVTNYTPLNLNKFLKRGKLSHIQTVHRATIDKATRRKYS